MGAPDGGIAIDGHHVACRKRILIEIRGARASCCVSYFSARHGEIGQTGNLPVCALAIAQKGVEQLNQRLLALAEKYCLETIVQIGLDLIGGIGSVDKNGDANFCGLLAHFETDLAHAREAHLRKKIETVFAHDDDARLVLSKRALKSFIGIVDHGVEDRHGESGLAHQGRSIDRSKRRIGLLPLCLLAVVVQVIRMCEQHFDWGGDVHRHFHVRAFCFPTVVSAAVSGECHSFVISAEGPFFKP